METFRVLSVAACAVLVALVAGKAEADAGAPVSSRGDEEVLVHFDLDSAPRSEPGASDWDLFVYVDGEPLARVPPASSADDDERLELCRKLVPGQHVLRVLQERHEERNDGWLHAARVAEPPLTFDLHHGEPAAVRVSFRRTGPDDHLEMTFAQGGRLESVEGSGDPRGWELLCEELEVSRRKELSLSARRSRVLPRCVEWRNLWPDRVDPPPRDEVREDLIHLGERSESEGS